MNLRNCLLALVLALILPTLTACTEAPITGRSQFIMVSDASMLSASQESYAEFLETNELSDNTEQTAVVKRIGKDIQNAVETWAQDTGQTDLLENYEWEFNLVQSDQVNAWCMPGGKIVVYTGMFPVAETEAGLATIMGHEVAHAIARHGAEQVTSNMVVGAGGALLAAAFNDDEPGDPNSTDGGYSDEQIAMISYGILTQVGLLLPHSRTQEREADHLGLIYMAMAGYNPEKAPELWQRMADRGKSSSGLLKSFETILSTHPTNEERIINLRDLAPDAMRYYRNAPTRHEDKKLPLTPEQTAETEPADAQTPEPQT
ncbi:TPR repeat-containing protein YfgC precursor [Anaerohalosphaera lusitana]|uniref:TPR repeat-containing protein YfgC n=1 Tax=Anaerohalosphaera lusitana TaxID=1936003 RepID=A0A1U9NI13_9BACT|nr:M48 family metallopeptidase [Anaerohalosphaera lusitana]AQT67455.1 TPR repeat-containing protein YfgC precursor [Anaerohalosphaera lusitana]